MLWVYVWKLVFLGIWVLSVDLFDLMKLSKVVVVCLVLLDV